MAPSLKGFYFDPHKKKYFKILPNHIAPQGVIYSEQAIKKQMKKNQVGIYPLVSYSLLLLVIYC